MKIFDLISNNNNNKEVNVFCDMDGVLAEYDIGNFDYSIIRPLFSNINQIKKMYEMNNVNVYILSICKTNNIVLEKIEWFKKYMPFFKEENMIFISKEKEENKGVESSTLKSNYLSANSKNSTLNILIDDDINIIKNVRKNTENIQVFHVSSIIE